MPVCSSRRAPSTVDGIDLHALARTLCDLGRVQRLADLGRHGPLLASAGGDSLFHCVFGRDAIRMAMDLLDEFPLVARVTTQFGSTSETASSDGVTAVTTSSGTSALTAYADGATTLTSPLTSGSDVTRFSDGTTVTTTCIGSGSLSAPRSSRPAVSTTAGC